MNGFKQTDVKALAGNLESIKAEIARLEQRNAEIRSIIGGV